MPKIDNLYYLEEDFNTMIEDKIIAKSSFSLLHVNARSLFKNIDQLVLYWNGLTHSISVIAISETWSISDNQQLLAIPEYNYVLKNRLDGRGGGVGIYV